MTAIENVRKFEEMLGRDEALQARLRELTEGFDGDKQDPRAVFEAVVAPLAVEASLPYTYDEALEYVDQRGDEDLTADEARAAAGGAYDDFCLLVGFGDVSADACTDISAFGVTACAGIGVGGLIS